MKLRTDYSFVVLIFIIVTTIFLFFYWTSGDTRTSLFAFNLAYTISLELLFFGFIYVKKFLRDINGAIYSVLATVIVFYVIFGFAALLIFNLFLLHVISVKWYYTFIILGTAIGIIAAGFSMKVNDSLNTDSASEIASQSHQRYLQELIYLEQQYKSLLVQKGIKESFESEYDCTISKLVNKLRFIDSERLREDLLNDRINQAINNLRIQISRFHDADDTHEIIRNEIAAIVSDTIFYINSIK